MDNSEPVEVVVRQGKTRIVVATNLQCVDPYSEDTYHYLGDSIFDALDALKTKRPPMKVWDAAKQTTLF